MIIPKSKINSLLGFRSFSRPSLADLQAACRRKLIEARRSGNDALAAELSQVKQVLKRRRHNACVDCGQPCGDSKRLAMRCNMHSRIFQFYRKRLPDPFPKHSQQWYNHELGRLLST